MKRPFLYPAVSFSAGILSCRLFNLPFIWLFALSAFFTALTLFLSKQRILSHISLYLAALFLGMAYYHNSTILPPDHISILALDGPRRVFIKGTIADYPVTRRTPHNTETTAFILETNSCRTPLGWRKAGGLLDVVAYPDKARGLGLGDEVVLEGLVSKVAGLKNPGVFDYSNYLAMKGVYIRLKVKDGFFIERSGRIRLGFMGRAGRGLRHKIITTIDRYMDERGGGFLKAILIGDRSALRQGIKEDFVKTGTVHIIAISGLNIGLIAALILFLFRTLGISRKPNIVLTVISLIIYTFAAGSSPPIVRATIMFSIVAIGYLISRDADILNSLSIAGIIILLRSPKELFDPSFQLSFLSLAGIIIFGPKIDGIFSANFVKTGSFLVKARIYALKGISITLAAWIGTWPLVAYYFNIISPVSILANLIVVPTLFLITAASFAFLTAALVSGSLAALIACALGVINNFLFSINHVLAALPFSYIRIRAPSVAATALYYGFIFVLAMPKTVTLGAATVRRRTVLAGLALLFNVLVWGELINTKAGSISITFLDVGQGDSIFIELPEKRGTILIDGGRGGSHEGFDAGRSVIAPYLWNKGIGSIDAVVVTHFHEDHLGGIIYLLKNFKIGCVVDSGAVPVGNGLYRKYRRLIKNRGIRHIIAREGDALNISERAKFFVLNPQRSREDLPDSNDNSIVLKFEYRNFSAIFCADVTLKAVERLNTYGEFLRSDVMKVPHHGSRIEDSGTGDFFFQNISPKIFVVTGANSSNSKAFQSEITNDITSEIPICYDTKRDGAVVLSIDPISQSINSVILNKN